MSSPSCPPFEHYGSDTQTPIQAVHVEVVPEPVFSVQQPQHQPLQQPLAPSPRSPPYRPPSRDTANSDRTTVELVPMFALCCTISSIFCSLPDCIGCRSDHKMLCINCHFRCCNTSRVPNECCLFNESRCTCVVPTVCCSGQTQCCCLDTRCALPCSKEVPCMLGFCFLMCCYNCQCKAHCCKTIGHIDHKDNLIIRE